MKCMTGFATYEWYKNFKAKHKRERWISHDLVYEYYERNNLDICRKNPFRQECCRI